MDLGAQISYMALEAGTNVICSDGEVVGTVAHVLAVEEKDIFDGIVIDRSTGEGGMHFVDAPEVAEIRERGVVLTISSDEVDALPKPEANPAVMEHHADDSESGLQHKLRRAWDMISGRY
jgi:hypothetical protein